MVTDNSPPALMIGAILKSTPAKGGSVVFANLRISH